MKECFGNDGVPSQRPGAALETAKAGGGTRRGIFFIFRKAVFAGNYRYLAASSPE
jgi:hypothetical protein